MVAVRCGQTGNFSPLVLPFHRNTQIFLDCSRPLKSLKFLIDRPLPFVSRMAARNKCNANATPMLSMAGNQVVKDVYAGEFLYWGSQRQVQEDRNNFRTSSLNNRPTNFG